MSNKYRLQVLLGVFTGLTTFAIEPCFQAALTYSEASGRSAIQRCESVQWKSNDSTIEATAQAALALEAALDNYNQTSNDDQILQELNTNCSSGDCSWPRISTLGVCSDCTNVTSSIFTSCSNDTRCNYTLPNGLKMITGDYGDTEFNITRSDCKGSNPTSYYQHWDDSFIDSLSVLMMEGYLIDQDPQQPAVQALALECILYWCILGYDTSVNGGVLYQNITGKWHGGTIVDDPGLKGNKYGDTYGDKELNMSPPRDQWADLGITQQTNFTAPVSVTANACGIINDALRNFTFSTDFEAYPSIFNYLTSEMTNAFRADCNDRVFGIANNLGLVTTVRWGWFALPAAAVSLTTVFLIWVASEQTEVWKSSPLALLFYGLTDKDRQDILAGAVETLSINKMKEVAMDVQIFLKEGLRMANHNTAGGSS